MSSRRRLRVWLIKIGEPLPCDAGNDRPFRMGLIARALQDRGHQVVWWSSTFNHAKRCLRATRDVTIDIEPSLRVRLIHSTQYRKNISMARLVNHLHTAWKLKRAAVDEPRPDIILSALPTPELCDVATRLGRGLGVPVVIDIRDLWPDILVEVAPRRLQWLARAVLEPYYRMTRRALRSATRITGVTPEYIEWGRRLAGRSDRASLGAVPMGYPDWRPDDDELAEAEQFWLEQYGLGQNDGMFTCCFLGAFSNQFDLETVIEAAKVLEKRGFTSIRMVLCGSGELLRQCRAQAAGCESVALPGWLSWPRIWKLMRLASIGLAPYRSTRNFTSNIPNKPIEYLSAGLPIVSNLAGCLEHLLDEHDCGLTVANGCAEELATAIESVMASPRRLTEMSENAKRLFRARFVASEVYGQLCDELEGLAEIATS